MPARAKAKLKGPSTRIAPTSRGSSAYARKRAVIACQVCRARRTKCDQKKPACSFCESIGAECVSDPAALSAFDPASVAILERLDKLEDTFSRFTHAANPSSAPTPHLEDESRWKITHFDHIFQQSVDRIFQWPEFCEQCSPASSSCHSPQSLSVTRGAEVWPGALRSTVSGIINEETHLMLLNRFFSDVHNRNPILDELKSRELSQKVFLRGVDWDAESCLTLLIWANGAVGNPLPTLALSLQDFEQTEAVSLFYAAQQRLGPALAHTGVLSAQCFFLAGVFLMSAIRPFDAWRMFSQALDICRTVKRTMSYNTNDVATLDRVFWSAWKSERELNRELWNPPKCSDYAMPQSFPTPPKECKQQTLQAWYFYLSEISAWRLETQIEEETTRFVLEVKGDLVDFAQVADGLIGQVSEWKNSLASEVSIIDPCEKQDMLRLILKARSLYITEMISWPFIYALIHEGKNPDHISVQQWSMRALEYHLEKLKTHRVQFYHRHHGTWLMIRSCARSACILIGASKLPFASSLMPETWRLAIDDTLRMFQFWKGHTKELDEIIDQIFAL